MAKQEKMKKEEHKSAAGLAIPAGLFVGMGLGFLFDELVAGLFIGLGCGFLLFLILISLKK